MTARTRASVMFLYNGVIVVGSASLSADPWTVTASLQGAVPRGGAVISAASGTVSPAQMPTAVMIYTPPGAKIVLAQPMTAGASLQAATVTASLITDPGDRLARMNISCPWRGVAVLPQTPSKRRRVAAMYFYSGLTIEGAVSIGPGTLLAGAALLPAGVVGHPAPPVMTLRAPARPGVLRARMRQREAILAPERGGVLVAPGRVSDDLVAPTRAIVFIVDPENERQ